MVFCFFTIAISFLPILYELQCVILLVQILTGAHLTKNTNHDDDLPHSDHHVQFDAVGESTRVFPIVQNESVVALTLLCSSIVVTHSSASRNR